MRLGFNNARDSWGVEAYVTNLSNTRAVIYTNRYNYDGRETTNEPRVFGLRLKYRFGGKDRRRLEVRKMRFGRYAAGMLVLPARGGDRRHQQHVARPRRSGLFIYNWSDFIGPDTIAKFEKLTGIKVTYDVYDAEETMEARLMAGSSGYDVVSASTDFFSREIKAGVYEALDKSKLTNWKNLDPRISAIQAQYDPGNQHAVPYLHSINGFAYNVDMVKARMPNAPVDSLDMIFKPEVVAKFADCGVTLIDSAEDVLQLALKYLGLDPNTTKREDFKAAEDTAAEGAPLYPLLRLHRVHEWPGKQGNLHRDVVVERLCLFARPRQSRRRRRESRLHGAEGRGESDLLLAVDPEGRAAPRSRVRLHQFHSAGRM